MFKKIKDIFCDTKYNPSQNKAKTLESLVNKTKKNILKRSKDLDFHLLGRSLSCNPFLPRAFDIELRYIIQDNKKIIHTMQINDEKTLESLNEDLNFLIVDTTLSDNISLVSTIRHYSPYLIIHKDVIISKYQILESAVYGADMIILDGDILDSKYLRFLFDFASNLGLIAVLSPSDIKNIESYFSFILLQDLDDLPYIQNDKIIIHQNH